MKSIHQVIQESRLISEALEPSKLIGLVGNSGMLLASKIAFYQKAIKPLKANSVFSYNYEETAPGGMVIKSKAFGKITYIHSNNIKVGAIAVAKSQFNTTYENVYLIVTNVGLIPIGKWNKEISSDHMQKLNDNLSSSEVEEVVNVFRNHV